MNPLMIFLNAVAAVNGSYLVCHGQWIVGTALLVVPLLTVYALALQQYPVIKQAGCLFNVLLFAVGLGYTFYMFSRTPDSAAETGAVAVLGEIWISLWLLALPAVSGWLLWTQQGRLRRDEMF